MARYTYSEKVHAPLERLQQEVTEILKQCDCEVIYQKSDYIMARETSGRVPFAKLVTVEAFADNAAMKGNVAPLHFVVMNEEITLHQDNHCYQRYQHLIQTIKDMGWDDPNSTNETSTELQ